jgi:hypothetical protein
MRLRQGRIVTGRKSIGKASRRQCHRLKPVLLLAAVNAALKRCSTRARQAPRWQSFAGNHTRSLPLVHEVAAAVLLPARFVALGAERFLLAIADGANAVGVDAQLHQRLLGRVGTIVAQRQVVFG